MINGRNNINNYKDYKDHWKYVILFFPLIIIDVTERNMKCQNRTLSVLINTRFTSNHLNTFSFAC